MSKTNITFHRENIEILKYSYYLLSEWRHSNLCAPYWRIIQNTSGISEVFFKKNIDKRRISLPSDRILLIPPHVELSCSNSSPVSNLNVSFLIHNMNIHVSENYYTFSYSDIWTESLESIYDGNKENQEKLFHLIETLLKLIPITTISPVTEDKRIDSAINKLTKNMNISISNGELADNASMSTNSFARLFKEQTGYTPHRFHLVRRVESACRSLQFTEDSIEKIALDCGFKDRFQFSKAFKKIMGQSPGRYKKVMIA